MRLFLSPLFINAPFKGELKQVKATEKGEKSKQGCDVTGDRTGTPRTEGHQLCHPSAKKSKNPFHLGTHY